MTTLITGQILKDLFNDTTTTVPQAEIIGDTAIDLLNTYGAGLTALTGAAGSKTGTYTSPQVGAIKTLSREVYATHFKNPSNKTSGSISSLSASYSSNNLLLDFAEKLAKELTFGMDFDRV